jgi:hypothetical protein
MRPGAHRVAAAAAFALSKPDKPAPGGQIKTVQVTSYLRGRKIPLTTADEVTGVSLVSVYISRIYVR